MSSGIHAIWRKMADIHRLLCSCRRYDPSFPRLASLAVWLTIQDMHMSDQYVEIIGLVKDDQTLKGAISINLGSNLGASRFAVSVHRSANPCNRGAELRTDAAFRYESRRPGDQVLALASWRRHLQLGPPAQGPVLGRAKASHPRRGRVSLQTGETIDRNRQSGRRIQHVLYQYHGFCLLPVLRRVIAEDQGKGNRIPCLYGVQQGNLRRAVQQLMRPLQTGRTQFEKIHRDK